MAGASSPDEERAAEVPPEDGQGVEAEMALSIEEYSPMVEGEDWVPDGPSGELEESPEGNAHEGARDGSPDGACWDWIEGLEEIAA